jgi:DNA-binding PadR family transcriptional regulator
LLSALLDGPGHGYEIIRRLDQRSGGLWRPSAGSVYPTLQLLEDQGLVTSEESGGRRVYRLTDAGRAEAEATRAQGMPWDLSEGEGATGERALRHALVQLQLAVRQVALAGDSGQVERAAAIVGEARQRLYQVLAEE